MGFRSDGADFGVGREVFPAWRPVLDPSAGGRGLSERTLCPLLRRGVSGLLSSQKEAVNSQISPLKRGEEPGIPHQRRPVSHFAQP